MPKGTKMHIDYYINAADSKMYVNKETHKRTRMLYSYNKDDRESEK